MTIGKNLGNQEIINLMTSHPNVKFLTWSERQVNYFKKWGARVISLFGFPLSIRFRLRMRITNMLFSNLGCNKDSKVLDLGCGCGWYVYEIQRLFKSKCVGVDLDEKDINFCKEFKNITNSDKLDFFTADITKYSDGIEYDFCIISQVLEHIRDDLSAVKNAYKNLKEGGHIIVGVPYNDNPVEYEFRQDRGTRGKGGLSEYDHVRNGYSVKTLTKLLKSAGFKKIKSVVVAERTFSQKLHNLNLKLQIVVFPLFYPFAVVFDKFFSRESGITIHVTAEK